MLPIRPTIYFRHCRAELLAYIPATARRILDVGCGSAAVGVRLRQRQACEVWGVECDPDAAREARANIDRVIEAPLDAALDQLPVGFFDALIAADVLEHLPDPWAALRRLATTLAPAATVLVSLPNVQHHTVIRNLLHGRFTYAPAGVLDHTHLRFFTRASAVELVERAGVSVEHVVPLYDGGRDRRAAQRQRPPAEVPVPPAASLEGFYASQFLLVGRLTSSPADTRHVRVSIVMLTFNRLDVTQHAIATLRASTRQPFELIIVDNGSSDGTGAYLDGLERDGVRVIRNDSNRGVAAGWNQGLRAATGECLMVLNNDVLVAGDWLERMVRLAYTVPRAGVVGCRTNYVGGPQALTPDYTDERDFPLFARRYAAMADGSWFECPRVVAVASLWRRELYERVGEFDERFSPANFEDDDYSLRALQAGYRNLIANDVFIHHVGHASQAANRLEPDAMLEQNRTRFIAKWGAAAEPVTVVQWAGFEEHIALLGATQYALPGWMVPEFAPGAVAIHLARLGRNLRRLGWRAPAHAMFRRSLRVAPTLRGLGGLLRNMLPAGAARRA